MAAEKAEKTQEKFTPPKTQCTKHWDCVACEQHREVGAGCAASEPPDHSYEIGKSYFFRGVTMYYVGELVWVTRTDFVLRNAAWVADTGRFNEALRTGSFSQLEPYERDVIVSRAVISDATEWPHPLPRTVK